LVSTTVERASGVIVFTHGHLRALIRLDEADNLIRHIHAFVVPPNVRGGRRA
jgi:hypothetical protein